MRRRWIVLALLLSLGMNVGLVATAWLRHRAFDRPPFGGEPQRDPGHFLAERLRLRGETRDRFLATQGELAARVHELRPRIAGLERDVRQELVAAAPDRAKIAALQDEIAATARELDRAFADNVLATRGLLEGAAEQQYLRFVERFPGARRMFGDRDPALDTPRHRFFDRFAPGDRDDRRDDGGRRHGEAPPDDAHDPPPPN